MGKDEIRAAMAADGADVVVEVKIAKWPGVYVRPVTLAESERVGKLVKEKLGDDYDRTAFACAMVICDANGERVFDPLSPDELAFLAKRRARDMNRILEIAAGDEKN